MHKIVTGSHWVWVLGLVAAAQVEALTPEAVAREQEEIIVTATRSAESIASLPMTVQVISREDILQQMSPGDNLSNVLGKLIPSAGVSTQVATNFSHNIRGREVLYLIDGVSQQDNRAISRFLNTLSPATIERIEVVSNASAVYGAGSAGGIINIITRQGAGDLTVGVTVGAVVSDGELTNKTLGLSLMGEAGQFDYLLSLVGETRGAEFDADGERVSPEPAQTSRFDADSYSLFSKLGWQLDEQRRLGLTLDYYRDEQDTDYGPNLGGPGIPALLAGLEVDAIAIDGLELENQPESKRHAITLDYRDEDVLGSVLHAQFYHRQREYRFFPFPGAVNLAVQSSLQPYVGVERLSVNYVNQSTSKARADGAKLTLNTVLNDALDVTWGMDYNHDQGEQRASAYRISEYIASGGLIYLPEGESYSYGPEVTTNTRAVFAHAKWSPAPRWTVRAGLRFEDIEADIDGATPPLETLFLRQYGTQVDLLNLYGLINGNSTPSTIEPGTIEDSTWLFNGGFSYQLSDNHTVFANYSEGFELPDYARLLRDGLAADSVMLEIIDGLEQTRVSETDLEAIEISSIELGWRMKQDRLTANAAIFTSRSDKTTVFNRNYTVSMLDQDKNISGFEASIAYELSEQWSTGASYAYTRGHTEENDGSEKALAATEVPPEKWLAYIGYSNQYLGLRLQGLHIGNDDRAFDDDPGEAKIDSYTVFDLSMNVPLAVGEFNISVKNLLNEDYQTVYSQWAESVYGSYSGIAAQGRTFGLSYSVEF